MVVRYIGSKARIAEAIVDEIEKSTPIGSGRFVDAFCGTGSVARLAYVRGWDIHANDLLESSVTLTLGGLSNLPEDTFFKSFGGPSGIIETLNNLDPVKGQIFKNYSPGGSSRMYFTTGNAMKIDAIRLNIDSLYLAGRIDLLEKRYLVSSLLNSMSKYSNTAGTYGAYLKAFSQAALMELRLNELPFLQGHNLPTFSSIRAEDLQYAPSDVVYFDPPYTKRQYSNYYHLQETVAKNEVIVPVGKTGLPLHASTSSDFSYKSKAYQAFESLLSVCNSQNIYISYSNQSHLEIERLVGLMSRFGTVRVTEIAEIPKYKSRRGKTGETVKEYLFHLKRQVA